jgi:hypothetical protein
MAGAVSWGYAMPEKQWIRTRQPVYDTFKKLPTIDEHENKYVHDQRQHLTAFSSARRITATGACFPVNSSNESAPW